MADSLVVGDVIELLGGGVVSTHPLCPGAVFRLAPGFDLSAPQPSQGTVASLLLGGGAPVSGHVDNRKPVLPVVIVVPSTGDPIADQGTLAGAREALAQAVSEPRWTMTWTRDSAQPMIFDCFAASSIVRAYSVIRDKQLLSEVEVAFDAMPYGRSDVPEVIQFAAPSAGWIPPPTVVTLDAFSSVSSSVAPASWSLSSTGMQSANSARWARQSAGCPDYVHTITPVDITGRTKLTLWVGLGTSTYSQWHTGSVTVQITLTDAGGNTVTIPAHVSMLASNLASSPRWNRVSAAIPLAQWFDFTTVSSYEIKLWNKTLPSGPNLQAECYLDTFTAAPASSAGTLGARGQLYSLPGALGTAVAPLSVQLQPGPAAAPTVALFTTTGSNNWTAPAGVVSVQQVEEEAGGAGGAPAGGSRGGGGGGGGEHVIDYNVAVTPATVYHPNVGAAGAAGTAGVPATAGGDSFFTGDAARTVRAHGGNPGGGAVSWTGGKGGTGSTAPVHHDGGDGYTTPNRNGGGGGGGGGTGSDGNDGSGIHAGAAVDGGGAGGPGGTADAANTGIRGGGGPPSGTYGGGGGGGSLTAGGTPQYNGGPGRGGWVRLTYSATLGSPLKTAVLHLPPRQVTAAAPLIVTGNGSDVPNGATNYTAPATGSVPGRYHGTYQVILVMGTWNTPANARTITWTIFQRLAGGASLSMALVKTLTPNTDPDPLRPLNGLVTMGTVNLPLAAIAPGNSTDQFQVTVNDTNTSDRVLDTLILDTSGQTVIYSTAGSGAANLWATEPDIGMDYGMVYGSATADWAGASSVLSDTAVMSGGPLAVLPGENPFLVYSVQGLPGVQASYLPRWILDRLA